MVVGEGEWLFIALISSDIDRGVNLCKRLRYSIIFYSLQLSQVGAGFDLHLFLMAMLLLHSL